MTEFDNKEITRRKKEFQEFLHSDDYQDKLDTRLKIFDGCERSKEAQQYAYQLCYREENSAEGCKFFVNNFGFTFDPRPEHAPHHLPFITFPFQDRAIQWFLEHIEGGVDGLVEKSRDMGMSWIFIYVALYLWLFRDGTNVLLGSYKEVLVDDKTIDSLFGKVVYALNCMPKWMLPKGFKMSQHKTHMKLINPANGNVINGDTMNPDFGRGARKTVIFFDELGTWAYAREAWQSSSDSTSCKIGNTTPKGYNFVAMLKEDGIDTLTLHWKEHPLKNEEWYNYECARRTEEEVAQELDISYQRSREGRVYPEWNDSNVEEGVFEYDPHKPLYVSWDFGRSDDTAIIWSQIDDDNSIVILDTYKNSGKIIEFYVPFVTGIIPSDLYKYTKEDVEVIQEHSAWSRGIHFGDPAGRFSNQVTNDTVIDVLKSHNITVNYNDRWKEFNIRKTEARKRILQKIKLNKNPRTRYFSVCMMNSSFPFIKNEGIPEVRSEKPLHNHYSHYRSSFEYLCLGLKEHGGGRDMRVKDKFTVRDRSKRRVVGY